jgi:ATP phosphoribosyltransferase regulatory subunit
MRSTVPPPAEASAPLVVPTAALAHPLPAGMRDLLPTDARAQGALIRQIVGCFELHGYELVILPVFEYAEVLERGLGKLDSSEVLRFVEPESGAVVALRPDMTPQVARLLATRLAEAPPPARLCYQGSVLRRRRERARRHRQIMQAGIELVGCPGLEGDIEVLSVASAVLRATGLSDFVIDLGHAGITTALLSSLSPEGVPGIVEALGVRDEREAVARAERAGLRGRELAALAGLLDLHGGDEVWVRAQKLLAGTAAESAAAELRALWEAATARTLAPKLIVDLAETRDFSYYTGAVFHVHARGPGQPLGAGGRYDNLYERFGGPRAAAGFAFRLDDLRWALESAGVFQSGPGRVLVDPSHAELVPALRQQGVACAIAPDGDPRAYAAAWRYDYVVLPGEGAPELVATGSGKRSGLPAEPSLAARAVAGLVAPSPGQG